MPKRISKKAKAKRAPKDVNQNAFRVLQQTIGESETRSPDAGIDQALLSRVMSEMGRKGGRVSGKRRMANLTPEKRREIALNAARTRWAKAKRNTS